MWSKRCWESGSCIARAKEGLRRKNSWECRPVAQGVDNHGPAQLLACARGRRRRSAAPALAYSSARPWRARHGCSISGQKRILHARMHAPPTQCSSCARMLLRPTQLFACLHTHACAAAARYYLASHILNGGFGMTRVLPRSLRCHASLSPPIFSMK